MILLSAETILASSTSKFGIEIPRIDDEDLNSSTESTIFDPLHRFNRELWTSTYLGLESYLPASKRSLCREFVKVKIRNLQSLLVCSIILWRVSSTEDDWIFGWRSRLASQILIFLAFHFSPLWTNGAALRLMNSIDAILGDKVLIKTHLDLQKRQGESNCLITFWSKQENPPFNGVRIRGVNPWSESMAVTAWLRSMNRRCYGCWNFEYAECTWNPERLEHIVDIPVPQIEKEVAEVDRFLHCAKQHLEPQLWGNRGVSGMSLYETGHSIQTCVVWVMCLSEHSSLRMHACFQLFSVWHPWAQTFHIDSIVPSQVSNHLYKCPHHEVVLLNSVGRSCHRPSKTCAR